MIEEITMQELHDRIENMGENEIILDVRTPEEFNEAHIPGSRNIPHEEVESFADELKEYDQVYVHCRAGKRAEYACELLKRQGLTNLVGIFDGGMIDWVEAGFDVEQGS